MLQRLCSSVSKNKSELKHTYEMEKLEQNELESLRAQHAQKLADLEKTQRELLEVGQGPCWWMIRLSGEWGCLYVCVCVRTRVCIHLFARVCMCVHGYVCVCVCASVGFLVLGGGGGVVCVFILVT